MSLPDPAASNHVVSHVGAHVPVPPILGRPWRSPA